MPEVTVSESAPSTFNTDVFSTRLRTLFAGHFGPGRVVETKPIMASEDFSQFWRADQTKQAVISWVGGTPKEKWDAAGGDESKLPSLHSPLWAPDADAVISTATEAMTVAALEVLKKG
jgi:hippurate hydrolase